MDRRRFVRIGLSSVLFGGGLLSLSGCGSEAKQSGTLVEMTPEDIQGFKAAESSYREMYKGGGQAQAKKKP